MSLGVALMIDALFKPFKKENSPMLSEEEACCQDYSDGYRAGFKEGVRPYIQRNVMKQEILELSALREENRKLKATNGFLKAIYEAAKVYIQMDLNKGKFVNGQGFDLQQAIQVYESREEKEKG